jgi:hypothetical protein
MLGNGADRVKTMQAIVADTPMRRFGEPDEVAAIAVLLASDEARYMTGAELTIDGGAARRQRCSAQTARGLRDASRARIGLRTLFSNSETATAARHRPGPGDAQMECTGLRPAIRAEAADDFPQHVLPAQPGALPGEWKPVCRSEARRIDDLELLSDSEKSKTALVRTRNGGSWDAGGR